MSEPSISQILADMGYAHRRLTGFYKHEVIYVATGEIIGEFDAADALKAAEDDLRRRTAGGAA